MKELELRQLIRESIKEIIEADDSNMSWGDAAKKVGHDWGVVPYKAIKKALILAKGSSEKIMSQIQASPEYKNIEAEIKKELQTGDKSKEVISKLMDILKKVGEILASTVSTEEKRKALDNIFKMVMVIPAGGVIYGMIANLINIIPFIDIGSVSVSAAVKALAVLVTVRIMLKLYTVFGSKKGDKKSTPSTTTKDDLPKDDHRRFMPESLNEEEDLITADEEEAILKLLQTK
tara:strand:- start:69 stop:767 length:699 start_codon:yes stop_codon:yes gene_type:complete